jgi:hypothetical protein
MAKRTAKMTNLIAVRLSEEQLGVLNAWRRRQLDPPSRAEAIRQLMEIGLEHEGAAEKSKGRKN